MKVDGSAKSLLQGVSQQPPRDRLSGQSTDQKNMSSDPVSGLTRRPPTDFVGSLGASSALNSWYSFETKNGNRYLASFRDSTLKVYNSNAQLQTLAIDANAVAYLTTTKNFVCTSQANNLLVSNTAKVPAMETGLTAYINSGAGSTPQAIIQVLGGGYGRNYTILLDGVKVAGFKTYTGELGWMGGGIHPAYIAEGLRDLLVGPTTTKGNDGFYSTSSMANATNWTVTLVGDMIHIKRNVGAVFNIAVTDDAANLNMKACTLTVPDISDVPRSAPHGYVLRVATETDPEEDVFIKFQSNTVGAVDGTGFGSQGFWQECAGPGIKYALDAATMPHVLEYIPGTDSFQFRREAWKGRTIGTTTSNPDPSFVGNPVEDISTFQNRIVFLAGANTIMTRSNKPTDFWMGSASAIVDSDPIDISSNAVQTSRMRYAVPQNRDIVIFAERGQFIIFGRTALTPANASLVLTTAFESSLVSRPAPSGRNVFFAISYGRYAGMREFYTEGGTDINDTRPITQHVKQYIEGTVQNIATASNYDIMLANTDTNAHKVYAYQYIWSDTEKVQSAWSEWNFAANIVYTFFDRDVFYLVVQDGTSLNLLRMPLDVEDSAGVEFPIHLDARFDVLGVNTQFTLPGNWLYDEDLQVVQGVDCPNPGMRAEVVSIVYSAPNYVVTLAQNMLGGDVVGGIRYRSSYKPTMPMVKDQDGVVVGTGMLRAKGFMATVERTGDISGQVTDKWRTGEVVNSQGRIIGDIENVIGVPSLSSGQFYLPYRGKADRGEIEFFTESFYPLTLLDIEWTGQYNKVGKRISTGG